MKSGHRVSIPNFIYWKLLLQCNHNLTSYFTTKKLDFQYRFLFLKDKKEAPDESPGQ